MTRSIDDYRATLTYARKYCLQGLSLKFITIKTVILSERGPRRSLQPGGGESKDLRLFRWFLP
jgi:hypothetical protein